MGSNQHSMEDDIAYIRANLATKYLGHPDDDALYALDRLVEQLEALQAENTKLVESAFVETPLEPLADRQAAHREIVELKEQYGTLHSLLTEITERKVNGLWSDQNLVDRVRAALNPASEPDVVENERLRKALLAEISRVDQLQREQGETGAA